MVTVTLVGQNFQHIVLRRCQTQIHNQNCNWNYETSNWTSTLAVIGMLQTGSTQAKAVADSNVLQSVVCRTTGDLTDIQRSGRPRCADVQNDRNVVNQAPRHRAPTATDFKQRLRHIRGVKVSGEKSKIAFTQTVITLAPSSDLAIVTKASSWTFGVV